MSSVVMDNPAQNRQSWVREGRLLIIDDDRDFAESLSELLGMQNFDVSVATSFDDGVRINLENEIHVALIDNQLGRRSGMTLIPKLQRSNPGLVCVMMTGCSTENVAVEAIKVGAYDYLRKPIQPRDLLLVLDRCFEKIHLEKERRESQRALQESERRYRMLFEESRDGILICNAQGEIVDVNHSGVELFGYSSRESMMGLDLFADLFRHLGLQPEAGQVHSDTVADIHDHETSFSRPDGDDIIALVTAVKISSDGVNGYRLIIRDVTARRKLEAQLLHSQKMEAIGTFAGGIAHDFNNLLCGMMGYADLAISHQTDTSRTRHCLDQVIEAGKRAEQLVDQILTFSRRTPYERTVFEFKSVVNEAVKIIRAMIPSTIEIVQRDCDGKTTVHADATQLHQVVMNLCTNAYQAMQGAGGKMFIGLDTLRCGAMKNSSTALPAGDYVRLTVTDTGMGMGADIRDRIFDPFYTTKGAQDGTGLGLSVVHGIVESHQGLINLDSEVGYGATFRVFIPQFKPDVDVDEADTAEPVLVGGQERVLIVDDEVSIATMCQAILEILGYTAESVTDSEAALDIVRNAPNDYDLIITDFTMPTMTGLELSRKIREIRPDMPIIMITGHIDSVPMTEFKEVGVCDIIKKPFLTDRIAAVIRTVLDDTGDPT